jgi:hypothetical protein
MPKTTVREAPQYTSTRGYADNPNPEAKIGFVVFYAFQFYVQKNIYKHVADEAEFIVDLTAFFPVRQPDDLVRDIITLLQKHGVKYRILHYEDRFSKSYLEEFFAPYSVLVSLWQRGSIMFACNAAKRKVHPLYGTGKELVMVHPSRAIFDLTLVYGKHSQKHCSIYGEAKIVGNPKFDDWFNDVVDPETVAMIRQELDPNKKTVLYLPTHGDLCSIDQIAPQLKALTHRYNIVVKLHYFTVREERWRIELLEGGDLILLKDDIDLLPLLKVADVVLSDNSSAIFDAILADKPLVTTDFLSQEYLDSKHKQLRNYRRGKMGAVTYSGSIEQVIKKERLVVSATTPDELADSIDRALQDGQFYVDARKRLRGELFDMNDGKSGERAANAIRELLTLDQLPPRPIMYHALEAYKQTMRLPSYRSIETAYQRLTEYENLLFTKGTDAYPFFSVVLIDDGSGDLTEAVRMLLWQKYPRSRYEIIVLSQRSEADVLAPLKAVLSQRSDIGFSFLGGTVGHLPNLLLSQAIQQSVGDRVLFTTSRYLVAYDWLARYAMWIYKLPHLVGLGGYEVPVQYGTWGRYSWYKHYIIARQLGLWELLPTADFYPVTTKSFRRNPMGMLGNVGYRKDFLEELDIASRRAGSWVALEINLKSEAIRNGVVAFIPVGVTNIAPKSDAEFKWENFERGGLQSEWGEFTSLHKFLKESLICYLSNSGRKRYRLLVAVFIASLFQWLGFRWRWVQARVTEFRMLSAK